MASSRQRQKQIINPNIQNDNNGYNFSKLVSASKRLTLTYIMLGVWIALAVFAIIIDADLYALAVYFASGLPIILGYLWSETSRPSIKDASDMVKNINRRRNDRNDYFDNYDNYNYYPDNYHGRNNRYDDQYNNINNVNNINQFDNSVDINIYSEDATVSLKVNENQLNTLMNIGYVDTIDNKYTFKKTALPEIKSLIDDNMIEPEI